MNELLKMSKQNKKLKKTLIFDINAGITCPNANECKSYVVMNANGKTSLKDGENSIFRCYAASQENQYPNVYKARKYNLDLIKKTLNSKDGFYKTYYSKSLHLFGTNISIPENFFLTASMGGLRDDLIHKGFFKRYAIVVNSEAEAIKKGIEHIGKPYEIDKDDSHCFENSPFALLIHGTQKKGYFKNLKK